MLLKGRLLVYSSLEIYMQKVRRVLTYVELPQNL
jgi:hypothetical protein